MSHLILNILSVTNNFVNPNNMQLHSQELFFAGWLKHVEQNQGIKCCNQSFKC